MDFFRPFTNVDQPAGAGVGRSMCSSAGVRGCGAPQRRGKAPNLCAPDAFQMLQLLLCLYAHYHVESSAAAAKAAQFLKGAWIRSTRGIDGGQQLAYRIKP